MDNDLGKMLKLNMPVNFSDFSKKGNSHVKDFYSFLDCQWKIELWILLF